MEIRFERKTKSGGMCLGRNAEKIETERNVHDG